MVRNFTSGQNLPTFNPLNKKLKDFKSMMRKNLYPKRTVKLIYMSKKLILYQNSSLKLMKILSLKLKELSSRKTDPRLFVSWVLFDH